MSRFRQLIGIINQSYCRLTFIPFLNGSPVTSLFVATAIFGYILRPCLKWIMGCLIRQIKKKWLTFVIVLDEILQCLVSVGIRAVKHCIYRRVRLEAFTVDAPIALTRPFLRWCRLVRPPISRIKMICCAIPQTKIAIKSTIIGVI